jgi:hypothetical protein
MTLKRALLIATFAYALIALGCQPKTTTNTAAPTPSAAPTVSKNAGPLPNNGFKAQITLPEPPSKLRMGQKETITVKVKNTSDVIWWQRGGEINDRADNNFYIALGNHWLDKDGKPTGDLEGHNGIPKDLRPGEEAEMTLLITAPKEPGEYTLELDMVQEAVSWFGEMGSTTTKAKVTVVK